MAKSKETLQLEKDIWRATYKQAKNDRDMYRDKYRELIFAGNEKYGRRWERELIERSENNE